MIESAEFWVGTILIPFVMGFYVGRVLIRGFRARRGKT